MYYMFPTILITRKKYDEKRSQGVHEEQGLYNMMSKNNQGGIISFLKPGIPPNILGGMEPRGRMAYYEILPENSTSYRAGLLAHCEDNVEG